MEVKSSVQNRGVTDVIFGTSAGADEDADVGFWTSADADADADMVEDADVMRMRMRMLKFVLKISIRFFLTSA